MDIIARAAGQIRTEIKKLQGALTVLEGGSARKAKSGKRRMSAAGRARIAAAQRARWESLKATAKVRAKQKRAA